MVRLKHRYLLINILYPNPPNTTSKSVPLPHVIQFNRPTSDQLTPQLLLKLIRDGVQELYGDYGSGMISASLKVNYLSTATSTAIVRVTRSHYRLVWAALSFVNRLPRPVSDDCVMRVVRVSGTIRKVEEEAIRRARATVLRARLQGEEGEKMDYAYFGTEDKELPMSIEDDDNYDEDEDESD